MHYDVSSNKITNVNPDSTDPKRYEFYMPTLTGPILNASMLEANENDELPVIGRGIPFDFVLDSKEDINEDGSANSLLLDLGWSQGCNEEIVVSDKCSYKTIHTNLDFNIYNKIEYYTKSIIYSAPSTPKVNFLFQNIGDDTYIISSQQYVFLRIIFPAQSYNSLSYIQGDSKDNFTIKLQDTTYTDSILAKVMLSNIPGNISNYNDKKDTNVIVLNNAIFDDILLENIDKIRIQILNENGKLIRIQNNFNLTLQFIEKITSLRNSNINSKTNQKITTLTPILNTNII